MDNAVKYREIIREVIKNVSGEFIAEHVNESVLQQLEKSWEQKLLDSGALSVYGSGERVLPASASGERSTGQIIDSDIKSSSKDKRVVLQSTSYAENPGEESCIGFKRKVFSSATSTVELFKKFLTQREPEVTTNPVGKGDECVSSDSEDNDQEPVTSNLVLGQFEKVARTKNKWKCSFKDGIMLLDGTEYIFGKGTAEFLW